MLVHHADSSRDRVARVSECDRATVDPDLASIGRQIAVENAGECRLAGAVLANQAVDGAAMEGQRDASIGLHRAETLVDAAELDRGRAHGESFSGTAIFPAMISARAASALARIPGVTSVSLYWSSV